VLETLPLPQGAPPQNLEAERTVIGSVLIDPAAIARVLASGLRPEHFYRDAHQKVFTAVVDLSSGGVEVDIVTLKNELERRGQIESVGGAAYLSSLIDGVPDVANVEHYTAIVKERSILRRLITAGQGIARDAMAGSMPAEEVLESAERGIFAIAEDRLEARFASISEVADHNLELLEAMEKRQGALTGHSTGFEELDTMTSGLQPSDLIIVAARPSMGKTSFCLNVAENMAVRDRKVVAFFSLEMSKEQLGFRVLCSQSRVNGRRVRHGYLTEKDWGDLARARQKVSDAPLFIDDSAGISVLEMRAKARRLKMEVGGLDCVMVDYLQLMSEKGRYENRNLEISAISRGLKMLAKDLQVPVVALSQLSRQPERRTGDHRPQLADLRESGAIEQDADLVAFIYRDAVSHPDTEDKGKAALIIAKQRNGPIGTVNLVFLNDITRFENLDRAADLG